MAYEIATTIALISVPIILSYLVVNFREDLAELLPLRVLFFAITMFSLILISQYAVTLAEDNAASQNIINLLTTPLYVLIPLGTITVGYIFIIIFMVCLKAWHNHKDDKTKSVFSKG